MLLNAFQQTGRVTAAHCFAATTTTRSEDESGRTIPRIVFIKQQRVPHNNSGNKKGKVLHKQHTQNNEHRSSSRRNKQQDKIENHFYNDIIQHMTAAAVQRKQHALTISTPTTTLEEDALINSGQLASMDDLICNFGKERIEREFTWVYVNSDWEDVFDWHYKVFAQCDDGGLYLVTSRRGAIDLLPKRQRISWTAETATVMHMCIHRFFGLNDDMWKLARCSRKNTHRGRCLRREAFTHLMAITQTIYHIDHWHNSTDDPEDLMDIAKLVTDRWRMTMRRDHESIGQDEDGLKGLEMFLRQLEDNWKKSESNVFLKGRFQFRWKGFDDSSSSARCKK